MAIDDTGDWWTGTEASDIGPYLAELTSSEPGYPATAFRPVVCSCGSDRFGLARAGSCTRRTCGGCGQVRFIDRFGDGLGWEEAVEDAGAEPYACVGCGGGEANVCLGFADYARHPGCKNQPRGSLPDAVLWFFVGVRCVRCGILGCFNDGKVGRGPMGEATFKQLTGEAPYEKGQS